MSLSLNGSHSIAACEAAGFNALLGWLEDCNPSTGATRPGVSSTSC
jgi:hypothetical protein